MAADNPIFSLVDSDGIKCDQDPSTCPYRKSEEELFIHQEVHLPWQIPKRGKVTTYLEYKCQHPKAQEKHVGFFHHAKPLEELMRNCLTKVK